MGISICFEINFRYFFKVIMDESSDSDEHYQLSCRLCGETIQEGVRKVKKDKFSGCFKQAYNVILSQDPGFLPKHVHFTCGKKLSYSLAKEGRKIPDLFEFPALAKRCRLCGLRNGHAPNCPKFAKKRKNLMDCNNKHFANKRIERLEKFVDEYCDESGEEKIDVLKFLLRKELYKCGKINEAKSLEKISSNESTKKSKSLTTPSPLTPQTTLARVVSSKRSFNQYQDDCKFFKQKGKRVFADPGKIEKEKWSINHKAVPFELTDKQTGRTIKYIPPVPPLKPAPPFANRIEEEEKYRLYRKQLSLYHDKLRPQQLQGNFDRPEEIHPHHLAVGSPYPNVIAFSLKDYAPKIESSLETLGVAYGEVEVTIEGSDGCDGMGDYELSSKPTDRQLPDHGLSYDFQLLKVTCDAGVLLESTNSSVFSLTPVMRAAANENNHFSTHHLTVPIENERSALSNCSMKVQLSDKYSLKATKIIIDTSKIDKKLADEQGGLGLSTYPCLLCTASKDEQRDRQCIMNGFLINRT